MTIEQRIEEPTDQFPVGMRVLAVDDDPTCLHLLEHLLRRCRYHVTTRTHAIAALNLLRENKNRFDLVISDVHMPDMDGFRLLELVGLEMDLPVIMLSANGDPKLVMKGITHGACDYLLKPVRIEELQIIWQHVIRKKKVDPKASENGHNGSNEGVVRNGNGDQKSNKKRKDQVEDEDEDHDENGLDSDDPSAQKKPRVVWSIELHRKFVAAVNHLGIDKAVPKRILELMNVEKLTRENVASHLQKYRLYLRRISCVQTQQVNMVAAFGNTDPASYMRINSLNGMGGFSSLSGSPQFQNAAFRSFQPNGMLGRLNSPASLGNRRLPSSGQANNSQFSGFSGHAGEQGTALIPGNPNGCILKGMPMSFEFDQLQDNNNNSSRSVSHVEELPKVDDVTVFPVSSGLPDAKTVGSSNTLMFQGHPGQTRGRAGIGNQSSATLSSLSHQDPFSDRARGNDQWPVAVQSSSYGPYGPYSGGQPVNPHLDDGTCAGDPPLSVTDYQYPINMGHERKQTWDNFAAAAPMNRSNLGHGVTGPHGQVTIVNSRMRNEEGISEFNSVEQADYVDSIPSSQGYQIKSQVYQLPTNVGSLEDLVSSMMK